MGEEEEDKDKKDEVIAEVRERIKKAIGLDAEEQESIEDFVVETIKSTSDIFEGMERLCNVIGLDPESVYAETVLSSMTALTKTRMCIAVPMSEMLEMFDLDDKSENKLEKDDFQLSEQELSEIAKMLHEDETKVAK